MLSNKAEYQQHRNNGLGRICHVDWTIVANNLCHMRKCTTVVEMKVGDDHAVQFLSQVAADVRKIRKPAFVRVPLRIYDALIAIHQQTTMLHYPPCAFRNRA